MNQGAALLNVALSRARREFALGNYTGADDWCSFVRGFDPDLPGANALVEDLCRVLRLREQGPIWAQDGAGPGQGRYLFIRAWGEGFWSDVFHVLGCLLLAEISGRTPVVYWGENSRFRAGQGEAFRQFWTPVSDVSLADVAAAAESGVYPPKWRNQPLDGPDVQKWSGPQARIGPIEFLNRPEPVIVSDFFTSPVMAARWLPPGHRLFGQSLNAVQVDLARRYLKPLPAVLERAGSFHAANMTQGPILAVHLRGSDKVSENSNLDEVNRATLELMEQEAADVRFFVLTDDRRLLDEAHGRFGARVISTASQRTATDIGLHYSASSDRVELGYEVMVDTFLAMACQRFLGNARSNVTCAVLGLQPWPPGSCRYFGDPLTSRSDPGIYTTAAGGRRGDFQVTK